jgi:hypothetical protein
VGWAYPGGVYGQYPPDSSVTTKLQALSGSPAWEQGVAEDFVGSDCTIDARGDVIVGGYLSSLDSGFVVAKLSGATGATARGVAERVWNESPVR